MRRWILRCVESLRSVSLVPAANEARGGRWLVLQEMTRFQQAERETQQMLYLIHSRLAVAVAELKSGVRREEGQALIEYALIISLIALVAITALTTTGTNIKSILNTIANEV